jgi:hypothetical protein
METTGTIIQIVGAIPLAIGILLILYLVGLEIARWWEQNPVLTIIALVTIETVIPLAILVIAAFLREFKVAVIALVLVALGAFVFTNGSRIHDEGYYQRLDAEYVAAQTPTPLDQQCTARAGEKLYYNLDNPYDANVQGRFNADTPVHVIAKYHYQLQIDSPVQGWIGENAVRGCATLSDTSGAPPLPIPITPTNTPIVDQFDLHCNYTKPNTLVRSMPSQDATVIGSLSLNDDGPAIHIVKHSGVIDNHSNRVDQWYEIEYANGFGWIPQNSVAGCW